MSPAAQLPAAPHCVAAETSPQPRRMPHGEHAVHGAADLSPSADRPARPRHWRPGGRVWQAVQRAAIAAALVGLGYGLSAVLHEEVPGVRNLALAKRCSAAAASGRPQELLSEDPYEELPGIRPHDAEYWQRTFPRQAEEMVNATVYGVRADRYTLSRMQP